LRNHQVQDETQSATKDLGIKGIKKKPWDLVDSYLICLRHSSAMSAWHTGLPILPWGKCSSQPSSYAWSRYGGI